MEEVASYFFGGLHTLTIDDKGRLTVPSSFRKALGEDVVLRVNRQERCVEILPPPTWNLFLEKLQALPQMDPDVARFKSLEAASAVYTSIDKQGRVLMPADMKAFSGVTAQAVVTGAIDRVKVWSPEKWASLQALAEEEDLAARVYEKFKL